MPNCRNFVVEVGVLEMRIVPQSNPRAGLTSVFFFKSSPSQAAEANPPQMQTEKVHLSVGELLCGAGGDPRSCATFNLLKIDSCSAW
jgi:hypothetical protein